MMDEGTDKQEKKPGMKRPPFVGLIAFLMGVLLGIFIPLSRRLRKPSTNEK
jgi:hypothetical protein